MDYINFTKEAEFEYMPVSYQTGTYDQKWMEKLCVQNYVIGAVLTEMYTHAEHLQKTTEVKTRAYDPTFRQEFMGSKWVLEMLMEVVILNPGKDLSAITLLHRRS